MEKFAELFQEVLRYVTLIAPTQRRNRAWRGRSVSVECLLCPGQLGRCPAMLSHLLPLLKYYLHSADGESAQQKEAADPRSQVSKCENSAVRQAWLGSLSFLMLILPSFLMCVLCCCSASTARHSRRRLRLCSRSSAEQQVHHEI